MGASTDGVKENGKCTQQQSMVFSRIRVPNFSVSFIGVIEVSFETYLDVHRILGG
jgi:hypothetical protein